ncbi:family 43 glycosylhydrolase [Pelagicoccus sp. NFK12]|uniref:Family 43 glycosylhydrolase n=1 Tax=Pelagicoccus enzymogenes TaxID=2773457 RepID=A0A927F6B2_9BACT|nr:family 43 glycosylhydrolase [Pelagicoccus enzymogenes]MBD5777965.1 family 43 glycosylhydrolase [Pelagicoccus enzymogenes]
MKFPLHLIPLLALLAACTQSPDTDKSEAQTFTYQNPIRNGIDENGLRDCQVLRDGDWWYMTGTSYPHWSRQEDEDDESTFNKGVALYRSKDLLNWEFRKYIVERGSKDKWYYRRFWAPEIQKIGGKYYALFNARNDLVGAVGQNTGYAVADHIEGPYTVVTEDKPLSNGNDLTFFEDDDGKVWAFWNRGKEFGIGFAQIDLATATLLTEPTSAIQPGKVDYAYNPDGSRAKTPGYDGRPIDKVAKYYAWDSIGIEGAYVVKRHGTYFLFYSSWTRGYEIGYATADKITGPWTKHPSNPFYGAQNPKAVEKNGFEFTGDPDQYFNQVGHNEIFTGPDGRLWLSCHGIGEDGVPMLVIDPLDFHEDGTVTSKGPTYTPQTISLK